MLEKLSKAISYIFHPAFIPSYLIVLLKLFSPLPVFFLFFGNKLYLTLLGLVFIYTALIPIMFVFLLHKMGFVSDVTLSTRSQRPRVYLFTSGFFIALAYFLYAKGNVFFPVSTLIATMGVNIIGLFLFTFFDKISAHASGIAGILGIFLGISLRFSDRTLIYPILCLIILCGVISSSRLYLGAHNLRQIVLGILWGLLTGFIGAYFFMIL